MNQGFWLMMAIISISDVTSAHTLANEPPIGDFNFLLPSAEAIWR